MAACGLCRLRGSKFKNGIIIARSYDEMGSATVKSIQLEGAKSKLNAGDHIMKDFYNFWREEYELVNRDLGCMVMCMAIKLDLVGADSNVHHGNAEEFAKKHGADDVLAKQLVTIIHDCETSSQGLEEPCIKVLEIAKCFKSKIHELKWAPSMEVVLEEIMTAV